MKKAKEERDYHRSKFIGAYVTDEQLAKVDAVAAEYDTVFSQPGRNRSRAIMYIIDCFDVEWLKDFPRPHREEK